MKWIKNFFWIFNSKIMSRICLFQINETSVTYISLIKFHLHWQSFLSFFYLSVTLSSARLEPLTLGSWGVRCTITLLPLATISWCYVNLGSILPNFTNTPAYLRLLHWKGKTHYIYLGVLMAQKKTSNISTKVKMLHMASTPALNFSNIKLVCKYF